MGAIVDQVCNLVARLIPEGNYGHFRIKAAPGALTEDDLIVQGQFPAVDTHIAVAAGNTHCHRHSCLSRLFRCAEYPGHKDLIPVLGIYIAPACAAGNVRTGMGMDGAQDAVFLGNTGLLLNLLQNTVIKFCLHRADGDADEDTFLIALPEIKGRCRQIIRHTL